MTENNREDRDRIWNRLDKLEVSNTLAHNEICNKLDDLSLQVADYRSNQPQECNKKYVPWKVIMLIIPIILGSYGFTWAYGSWLAQELMKHITNMVGG